ncbi:hypothetical protein [Methanobrevibacter curvatus]|uniref:Uncharacterized protein n=1 Tax=Methanobrevibacter curvatus TaxID=49547 RepID=A0A166CRD8_9EURY|nr:hypothetical protein [Methanobrevibacter curvatus]KZX16257.1 hypothetical protein MBCUR_01040 [Methanobrevibacter curvatus]
MTKEKDFDCVKFKRQLQDNVWKSSGAKNTKELVDYINKQSLKSSLRRSN